MCGFAFCNFACGFCNKNKFIMLMKKLFIAIMCVFVVTQLYAETGDVSSGRVHFRTVKYNTNAGQSVHRTPYHSAAVTSSYNEASALFTLWFHYAAEDAEVLITKDGETVAEGRLTCRLTNCWSVIFQSAKAVNARLAWLLVARCRLR